jgi:hypothetical protein
LLLIMAETGELALVEAAGAKSRELGRFKALTGDKTWNCPCLAGGKAYIHNHREMACYDLRNVHEVTSRNHSRQLPSLQLLYEFNGNVAWTLTRRPSNE